MILLSRAFSSPGVGEWGLLRLNQVTVSGMGQQVGQQKGVCVWGCSLGYVFMSYSHQVETELSL